MAQSTTKAPRASQRAIQQATIERYATLKSYRLEQEKLAAIHAKEEKELREQIVSALENGATIQKGKWSALCVPRGRWPDWKGAYVEACGEVAAKNVIEQTPYRMELVVSNGRVLKLGGE